jgi:hypothetical protein
VLRPRGVLTLTLLLGIVTTALAPASTGTAQPTAEFAEGKWEGFYGMNDGSVWADGVDAEVLATHQALGNFELTAAAGTATGRWLVDVYTVVEADGVRAEADGEGIGVLDGNTRSLEMVFDRLTVTEPTIGMTLSFTAGELPAATGGNMDVTGADCNSVRGNWSVEFPSASLGGQFTAIRVGAAADEDSVAADRQASMEELTSRGRSILRQVREGIVDLEMIRDLLQDVEGGLSYPGSTTCGGADDGSFRSATTELIDSMLFELADDDIGLDPDVLIELVIAGFRSGVFSSDTDARDFWLRVYDDAVEAALAGADVATLAKFSAASRLLGFDVQADTIDDLLAELGS